MKYILIPLFKYPYRVLKVLGKFLILSIGFILIFLWTFKFEDICMWNELYKESSNEHEDRYKQFNSLLDYILDINFEWKG